jgi:RNA polymerase sigma-70 factor (ECF subfamily)
MPTQDPLAEILSGCAHGDRRAFEELYHQSSAKLYAICLALLKREDLAEDVLQDSFIKIWHRSGSFEPSRGSAMTWMISIVRNRALGLLRSTHVQTGYASDEYREENFAVDDQDPAITIEIETSAKVLLDCLGQLKKQQRRCIMMAYYYGHTPDELSTLMSTPLGTMGGRARRRFRELMAERGYIQQAVLA